MRDSATLDEIRENARQTLRAEIAEERAAQVASELPGRKAFIRGSMADDPKTFFRELVGADTSYGEAFLIAIAGINREDAGWPELLAYKAAFTDYINKTALAELGELV
jgi:hypothetical protein